MEKVYYDFHIHSCLSPCGDNNMTPANIAGMAFVNGLNAIALTDHNSVKNCWATKTAAEKYGICFLYGMELTTQEEVHTVCLFPNEASANSWNDFVFERLQKIKNNPDIFGNQHIMNDQDIILGQEEYLLINAVDISFEDVFAKVESLGGIAFPAHVDKKANSLISNLGFVPPDSTFSVAEVKNLSNLEGLKEAHSYFKKCLILSNSDAHYLEDISKGDNFFEIEEITPESIIDYLKTAKI